MIVFALVKVGKLFFVFMAQLDFLKARSHALDRFRRQRILVLGDVILDRYLWGEVDRVSPEAPVPVVVEGPTTELLGGALNVARNLVAAGARAEMVGVIGFEDVGRRVHELMKEIGISVGGVVRDRNRPTTVKTRIMSRGQQLFRLDRETTGPYGAATEKKLIEAVRKRVPRCGGLIISDYKKGVVTESVVRAAIAAAHRQGIPVIVDPKVEDFAFYRGADYLTPNLKEASAAIGRVLGTEADIQTAGRALVRKFRGKGILITRGHEGVSLIAPPRSVHVQARAQEVFDVTGAGDTFISHFALGLVSGLDPAEAAHIANAAAGVAVSKLGAVTVSPGELAAALGSQGGLSKVRSVEDLRFTLEHLRAQKQRIVLTNGCFDLFHAGHVHLLHEARALGDVLVVAVNTDASVRRIKGKPRPILPEPERAAVLSALAVVDYVVFFDEDSPERLIGQLRPDVLVKGKQKGGVVGRGLVSSYGGKTVELPLFDVSTTGEVVRKIREGSGAKRARASASRKKRRR